VSPRGARKRWSSAACMAALLLFSCQRDAGVPPGAFVVLLDAEPKGFDPRFPAGDSSAKIMGLVHRGLVNVDNATGAPELALAASITQPTPTTYEITLRPDARFHDGQPVTAADVEYTLLRLGDDPIKSPLAGLSKRIKRLTVHDPLRLTIELNEPHAPFLSDLAMGIVPKHLCDGLAQCPEPVIGAGPFVMERVIGAHTVILRAFDGYYEGTPPIKSLAFQVVKDDNTRLIALLGGTASLVQNAVQPLMMPVVEEDERLESATSPSFKYTYLAFNMRRDTLKDVRVRQAIALGLDREAIIHYKYRGLAGISTGMLSPAHWAYEPDVERFGYDPARARALLDEAGYPDPDGDGPQMRFEIELKISSNKFRRSLALLMAQQLAQIGVGIKVRAYEWGTFFNDIKGGSFDITMLQWPSVMEPNLYHWVFHSSNIPSPENRNAGANRGAYVNKELDELLDAGALETDMERRKNIYSDVQKILAHDVPYVSLWHEDNIVILKRGTRGYTPTPNARFEALKSTIPPE
jgi:peptide/nickel transport system substrate-binding protein